MNPKKAFTLLETLLVVAAIAILAGIVILAINPSRQLALDRNVRRLSDVQVLLNAAYQKTIDSTGSLLSGLTSDWQMIGTATSGCSVSCGSSQVTSPSAIDFLDSGQSAFDAGSYYQTFYSNSDNAVELNAANSGTFTSSVKNNNNSNWTNISWQPAAPYGKPLLNNQQTETVYSTGNVNMSGNVLLLHFNETSGQLIDSSGFGNNGTSTSVTYGVSGKYSSSLGFNGTSSTITISNSPSLSVVNNLTYEAWVMPGAFVTSQILQKGSWDGSNLYEDLYSGWRATLNLQSGSGASIGWSSGRPIIGAWYHLAMTYDGSMFRLYVNGSEASSTPMTGAIKVNNRLVCIGSDCGLQKFFNGRIDEVAIYNRALSSAEILDRYNRGTKRLKLKVRACPDQTCTGINFIGPDGTVDSYYSDNNSSLGLPSSSITGLSGSYFQYQVIMETDTSVSPKLSNLTVSSSGSGSVYQSYTTTTESCLNLGPVLTPDYVVTMPYDPRVGSLEKTYYAIKKSQNNRISVMSCSPELEENIILSH
ncbi:MAG: LamG-like jellyroll fold domain-containing protein [Candidatus Falkowbacteria bacterium]